MSSYFSYFRRVAFSETDAMGVVHHSNYVRYFEEARVEWLRDRGLLSLHAPYGPWVFAVVDLKARYRKPARFDDELDVRTQARLAGARILFQYAIWCKRVSEVIAEGWTTLVPVTAALCPGRLPREVRETFAREPWDETWIGESAAEP